MRSASAEGRRFRRRLAVALCPLVVVALFVVEAVLDETADFRWLVALGDVVAEPAFELSEES